MLAAAILLFGSRLVLGAADGPVAILWVGEDGGASVVPHVDLLTIENAFESHGFRLLRIDGASPPVLARVILADRAAYPGSYTNRTVSFVLHGRGVVAPAVEDEPLPELPRKPVAPVREQDLIAAFLLGIGGEARAEIRMSVCYAGHRCHDLDIKGSPLERQVTKLSVPDDAATPDDTLEQKKTRVLTNLLELLIGERPPPTLGDRTVNGTAGPATGPASARKNFRAMAEREALLASGDGAPSARAVEPPSEGLLLVPGHALLSTSDVAIVPGASGAAPDRSGRLLRRLREGLAGATSRVYEALSPAGTTDSGK